MPARPSIEKINIPKVGGLSPLSVVAALIVVGVVWYVIQTNMRVEENA